MHKLFAANIYLKIFLLFALLASCGEPSELNDSQFVFHVSGSIIDFQSKSFTQVSRITIITSDGEEYDLNVNKDLGKFTPSHFCLLYTYPSQRDRLLSRMPSWA